MCMWEGTPIYEMFDNCKFPSLVVFVCIGIKVNKELI